MYAIVCTQTFTYECARHTLLAKPLWLSIENTNEILKLLSRSGGDERKTNWSKKTKNEKVSFFSILKSLSVCEHGCMYLQLLQFSIQCHEMCTQSERSERWNMVTNNFLNKEARKQVKNTHSTEKGGRRRKRQEGTKEKEKKK